MSSTSAKIVLAVGLTALFTAVILIAAFVGFMYFRTAPEIVAGPAASPTSGGDRRGTTRRPKGPFTVAADEITEVRLRRSSMASTASSRPAAFFSNINVQNYTSSTSELSFRADGTATKVVASEKTVDGMRTSSGPTKYVVNIGTDAFRTLANVLVDNDFANEPKSREITSLPVSVTLTVVHDRGETVVMASNMGKDTPEMTAILKAIDDLDAKTNWGPGIQ